jgi:hypothetical protein
VLNKLWRSGDRERDVIYTISYRTNIPQVPIAVQETVRAGCGLDGKKAERMEQRSLNGSAQD